MTSQREALENDGKITFAVTFWVIVVVLILLAFANSCFGTVIAQYKMNDNAATTAVVDAGATHAGVFSDITGDSNTDAHSVTGKTSTALDFDGTDDYVYMTDHADFTAALTPLSISAWVYMETTTSFSIISKLEAGKEEWAFGVDGSSYLYFEIWDQSYTSYIGRYYQYALTDYQDSWIHVVVTYDGGNTCSSTKLYLHGTQVDDNDFTSASTWVSSENLDSEIWIGRKSDEYSDGYIDNVILYDTELTPSQVDGLYNNDAGTEETGLSSYASSGLRSRWADGYRKYYRSRYRFE